MTMRALAVLRTQPPAGLGERLLLATQGLLPRFTAQELANTAWGLAKLRMQPPSEEWGRQFCAAVQTVLVTNSHQSGGHAGSSDEATSNTSSRAQSLSVSLYSMALLGLRPEGPFLEECLRFTMESYSSFTMQVIHC